MFKRFDSLFARLLLAQAGLVLALAMVMVALFYAERSVTMAELYADRWAPQLASAAGLSAERAVPQPLSVLRSVDVPDATRRVALPVPRFAALRRELALRNVPVDELRLSLGGAGPVLWLRVVPEGQPAVWLGVAGQLLVSEWSRRTVIAMVLVSAILVAVAWAFTRRLTRPLEQLRTRMVTHTPGRSASLAQVAPVDTNASPEIAAIHTAYADLLARMERHERERAVLLGGVSHDLRSPLARIAMAADLLPDAADTALRKASITRNVREANRLIESFLDFVRAGELVFVETVDLADAARQVVAAFERPASELSLEVLNSPLWRAQANRLLVERLLANLIDNALKHGCPPVCVQLGGDATQAWIAVTDHGAGVAVQHASHLQEAFTRGDPSRAVPGVGLGLTIVREVAARLGGSVSFDQDAQRSRVLVTLGPLEKS